MNEAVVTSKPMTLLELLDRLLETGVVAEGKVLLSVADVDLIYLGVRLVLSSVGTLEQHADQSVRDSWRPPRSPDASAAGNGHEGTVDRQVMTGQRTLERPGHSPKAAVSPEPAVTNGQAVRQGRPVSQPQLDIEPEKVERGLAKLVLTIVELLRRLMESQAVRRMDQGTLSANEIERLGQAFSQLEARMEDLKKVFGLEDEELNLDLGPIGKLV